MERSEFLKKCGAFCLGGLAIPPLLQSCKSFYYASSEISDDKLKVKKSEFRIDKNEQSTYRSYVLVNSDKLNFPIYLYRFDDNAYSALWMECSHQGAELSAHGDTLSCPAHGSEFDKNGNVTQGPAQRPLRKFATSTDNEYILISLAK